MEVNGTLTGFSIDLWNAIAEQLKLQTSYQIEPDVGALEEAMRSKSVDLSLGVFITSARDAVFDFSIPTMEAGLQIIVLNKGSKAHKESPLGDIAPTDVFAYDSGLARHGAAARPDPGSPGRWFERRKDDGIVSNRDYFPGILEAVFLGDVNAHDTGGGDATSMGWPDALNLLDVRRRGFRCVLHRPIDDSLDGRPD